MSKAGQDHPARLSLGPTFTAAQVRAAGGASRELARLVEAGELEVLSRGVYRWVDAPATAFLDLIAVHARVPHGVLCGETALALHELIDDIPAAVHVAVRRGATRPVIDYPPTVIAQFAAATFTLGVERFEAAPEELVPVYGQARAVVDAMRLRSRMGETLALGALGRYVRRHHQRGVRELLDTAEALGSFAVIRPAVEAVLA
jgi:predicted transcriptional regulator of viral defense system